MILNLVKPSNMKPRKRVGRGIGSGTGKTAGSGHNGQCSRSGASIKGFEGGQTPLYRRLPKVGFTSRKKIMDKTYVLKIDDLLAAFEKGLLNKKEEVNIEVLKKVKIVKSDKELKLIGSSKIDFPIIISLDKITAGAKSAVESAGGSVKGV